MKKEISFYRNNRKELFNQVKRKLMQEVGEILKQFLPILDMWRGGIKAINQLIPIYKISFFLVNFVLGTPFLHLLIFFLILKKLEKEIRFYQNFFGEQHKASFLRMAGEKLIVYFIVLVFICLVFVVIREKFAERLFFRQKEKKNFESLARNSLLYFFGLRSNVFDRGDFVGKTGGGRQRKLLFLVLFLFIFFLIEKRVFFVARDKFEFYPYIHNVFVDIASSWQEFNVYGFNFRDLPFKGKVLVNGKEIRVLVWSDKLIVAEADPANPSSGDLEIVNDYGFGKGIYSNKVRFNYFDSRNASAEEEKKFWSALKEKARRKSGEIGADDWK